MREKPALQDERIFALLGQDYGLQIAEIEFLPLGADTNTAVYRVITRDSVPFFLKIRKGGFEETSILVPQFLHKQGIQQIIPPHKTKDGRLWSSLDAYACILYPYISGRDGFEVALSDDQWIGFGSALKGIHAAILPPALQARILHENFSPHWRESVKSFQAQVERTRYPDPVASKMAAFMRAHRDEISFVT